MRRLPWVSKAILGWIGVVLAGVGYVQAANQERSIPAARQQLPTRAPEPALPYRAVLDRYCITCHNDRLKTAGLMLDRIEVQNVPAGAEVWEKVIRKLRAGAMPPAGLPRPDASTYDAFAGYLERTLDRAAEAKPNPGRTTAVHRLNRAEYSNAIRDLVAIDTHAIEVGGGSLLPADESAFGFDNIGSALSVSPLLFERYLSAAKKISRLAVGDPGMRPFFQTYKSPEFLLQDDRMSDDLPFGSRGGIAIRHYFPLDGEYVVTITLQKEFGGRTRGLDESHQLDVRVDGARITLLTVGGPKKDPRVKPDDDPAGTMQIRFPAKAGSHLVGVAFVEQTFVPEGALQPLNSKLTALPRLLQRDFDDYSGGDPAVDMVAIGGPYGATGVGDTPSRQKIFVCRPASIADEGPCAKKILSTLARRAYRQPVTDHVIEPLLAVYNAGRAEGGFEAGIESALEAILCGPEFLFRIESEPPNVAPGAAYRVSGLELASRLSFFLWSSIPDEQLLSVAERGRLHDPKVLQQEVRRMLDDPRSKALVSNFAFEWLSVHNLSSIEPDPDTFPDFDWNLRDAFQQETELFIGSVIRERRSVLELLNADYTFLNERLARHYGIPNIYGSDFRRVTLNDENRRGLLGQGSILSVTSYSNRTAPTIRGKWLLENILGTPPPPPPPNVPSLTENQDSKVLTMRQRMEQHRKNPVCASCHARMDPLGFALENFDATGKWRSTDGGARIDASGVLTDGTTVDGPARLRKVLLSHPEQFLATFTEKLLTYSLGREIEYYDAPVIRKIVRESGPDHSWLSLTLGIVNSTPFQFRRSAEVTPGSR